jgi:hypothetical protein
MSKFDIFTPPAIAQQMQSYLPTQGTLLEPSVGKGALIAGLSGEIHVYDINPTYMESVEGPHIRKHVADFLVEPIETMYERIISNPPFQKFQDMSDETRTIVRSIHTCLSGGNIDMYVAFLVKCIYVLSNTGTFVAICPSTWLFNVSCRKFREFLYSNRYIRHIHDFGSQKVFPADVYCTIVVFDKTQKTHFTYNDRQIEYLSRLPRSLIHVPTDAPTLASVASIQNGIATLCDKVFIHKARMFDEPCWKPIMKVSKQANMWAIVPALPENIFKRDNPQTYAYLETHRAALAQRDKGKKVYPSWYMYGRQQGLVVPDAPQSVYISTMCNPDLSKSVHVGPTQLFYSGLRITPNTVSCETIVNALLRTDFTTRCSKRSKDWLNMTASVLKSIPI